MFSGLRFAIQTRIPIDKGGLKFTIQFSRAHLQQQMRSAPGSTSSADSSPMRLLIT